jgi:hypothetical protein
VAAEQPVNVHHPASPDAGAAAHTLKAAIHYPAFRGQIPSVLIEGAMIYLV